MMKTKCFLCDGEGKHYAAMDLLLRDPREQAEYEAQVKAMGKFKCGACNGAGVIQENSQ